MNLNVYALPTDFSPETVSDGVAVVIDILRASTTIVHALDAGAACVMPFESIAEAQEFNLPAPANVLRGGERGGEMIDGFDLGNSPLEYVSSRVRDSVIAFTTTNGTRAMLHAAEARQVLIGAFVNLSSIVAALQRFKLPVHLVCAGTDGYATGEDLLFAGAVTQQLSDSADDWKLNDRARDAAALWSEYADGTHLQAMTAARGGCNLMKLGREADIRRAAEIDRFSIVPIYDPLTNAIHIGEHEA